MPDFLFYLALGFLFTHEMDATWRHEWRLLPILKQLPDETGRVAFVLLHVPLFAAFIWLGAHPDANVRDPWRVAVSAFGIIHTGLHWLLRNHPKYEFNNAVSWSLIVGYGLFGLLCLAYMV